MFQKFTNFIKSLRQHKIRTALFIILIIIAFYYGYKKIHNNNTATQYVLTAIEKGTLVASISGSGQVSASNQVDVKAQSGGDITSIIVKNSQEVKAGAFLAQIDANDAIKAVRDAKTNLETAQLELEQTLEPADELTVLQAETSLIQAQKSKQDAEDNLIKSYEDGFNTVSNIFLELPDIMTGLNDILFSYNYSGTQSNIDYYSNGITTYNIETGALYRDDSKTKYQIARASYDKNFNDYKNASRFSATSTIENLILESYETTKNIAEAVKSANNLIRLYQDTITERGLKPQTLSNTHLTNLSSDTNNTNSYLTNLLSSKSAIKSYQENIISAERSIKEKELSLEKIKDGSDELTIRAKKIAVQQKQDALTATQQTLADTTVRAPFNGIIAAINAKKGDIVSSGATIATLITKQKIAEISLNEVDAARVKIGQKATLTFDAISDLSITGEVTEIDTIGNVSQGVVNYNVKIIFDVTDERIKPGMSTSVAIIIESKSDVLMAPISAVKTSAQGSYVEILVNEIPQRKTITTGSSNDTMIEIVSGLTEGEKIITQTISNGVNSSSSSNSSSGQKNAVFGSGGGEFRMLR